MKKLSEKHKRYLIRRAAEIERQHRTSKTRRRLRAVLVSAGLDPHDDRREIIIYKDGEYQKAFVVGDAFPAPKTLSFSENYEETATFIANIRNGLTASWRPPSRARRRVMRNVPPIYRRYADFTTIRSISAPVALIIAAEYDRIRKCGGWRPSAVEYQKWDPAVRAKLDQIGFLSLAGAVGEEEPIVQGDGWRLLRLRSGFDTEGETANDLIAQLGVDVFSANPALYEAMIEALANIKHHAYPRDQYIQMPYVPGWWMTGLAENTGRLTIMVCDQGVTIPGSLSNTASDWELYSSWQKLCLRATGRTPSTDDTSIDGAAIAAAMKVGRTSTNLSYRGRGLKTFERVLDVCQNGSLTIRSRCGEYKRTKSRSASFLSRVTPLHGTLITWQLQI